MKPWILSISIAYLLGSIPFGYLLVRIFRNEDIREQGSGNIGATNVARSGAKGLGVATLLLDLGKAYAGVVIAAHIAAGLGNAGMYDVEVAAAVAAVVGHVFPVWLGFRGGKGVASALGVFLALTWPSGAGDLAGVCGGFCADPVCLAGVDCGGGDVSAVRVPFCGAADADGGVWIPVYSAAGYCEAP